MKSTPYSYKGKLFRYDYGTCEVEYIYKADEQTIQEEIDWFTNHGSPLFGIDLDGYITVCSVGLSKENWYNKAVRDEYLFEYCNEIDSYTQNLFSTFIRTELNSMREEIDDGA